MGSPKRSQTLGWTLHFSNAFEYIAWGLSPEKSSLNIAYKMTAVAPIPATIIPEYQTVLVVSFTEIEHG